MYNTEEIISLTFTNLTRPKSSITGILKEKSSDRRKKDKGIPRIRLNPH